MRGQIQVLSSLLLSRLQICLTNLFNNNDHSRNIFPSKTAKSRWAIFVLLPSEEYIPPFHWTYHHSVELSYSASIMLVSQSLIVYDNLHFTLTTKPNPRINMSKEEESCIEFSRWKTKYNGQVVDAAGFTSDCFCEMNRTEQGI